MNFVLNVYYLILQKTFFHFNFKKLLPFFISDFLQYKGLFGVFMAVTFSGSLRYLIGEN